MAMEKQFVIRDTHTRPVTALGYNPSRREFMIGCEGGSGNILKSSLKTRLFSPRFYLIML